MTTIPKPAREAARSAVGNVKILHGFVRDRLTESEMYAVVDAGILAALPHLGEPVEWQRYVETLGWMVVDEDDRRHYREKGAKLRALYLAPPEPAVPVGWKLVPIEPTVEMVTAPAIDPEDSAAPDASERVYRAMLTAAPELPAIAPQTEQRTMLISKTGNVGKTAIASLPDAPQAPRPSRIDRTKTQLAKALRASDQSNHDMLHMVASMISAIRTASPKLADRFQALADTAFEKWPRTETAEALAAFEKEKGHG